MNNKLSAFFSLYFMGDRVNKWIKDFLYQENEWKFFFGLIP